MPLVAEVPRGRVLVERVGERVRGRRGGRPRPVRGRHHGLQDETYVRVVSRRRRGGPQSGGRGRGRPAHRDRVRAGHQRITRRGTLHVGARRAVRDGFISRSIAVRGIFPEVPGGYFLRFGGRSVGDVLVVLVAGLVRDGRGGVQRVRELGGDGSAETEQGLAKGVCYGTLKRLTNYSDNARPSRV